jgi:putative phage-type endonuclease
VRSVLNKQTKGVKVETESQRKEWLKWRRGGIGSSDAAAIHGLSPHMTKLELYEDKFGEEELEEETSFIMERGNIYEPTIRKLFAAEYNIENLSDEEFQPRVLVSADLSILRASLDGCTKAGDVAAEFKYQGKDAHIRACDEKAIIRGVRVPGHYWVQVQHLLLVSGAKFCYFVSYNPKAAEFGCPTLVKVKVEPDIEFWQKHVQACVEFWDNGLKNIPPEASEKDYKTLTKKGAKKLAKRMSYLKEKMAELEAEYEELKPQLLEMVDHPKMKCAGLLINIRTRTGTLDYKKIPEVKALSKEYIEQFRGKTIEYKEIKLAGEEE